MGHLPGQNPGTTGPVKGSTKKAVIAVVFLALLLFFLIRHVAGHQEEFKQLLTTCSANGFIVFFSALLFILLLALNGLQFNVLVVPFGLKLPVKEWLGLAVVTNFYNLFTPFRGGMAIRALFLKKRYNFNYTHYLAVQAAVQVFILFTSGLTGLTGILTLHYKNGKSSEPVILFLLAVTFLLGALLFLPPSLRKKKNGLSWIEKKKNTKGNKWIRRLAGIIVNIFDGWRVIKSDRKRVAALTLLSLGQRLTKGFFMLLVYLCFDIQLDFFAALFIASVGMFSLVITLLPGNLGIDDAINIFSARLIGIPLDAAIAATLLARLINLAVSLVLGPLFSALLLKKKRKNQNP